MNTPATPNIPARLDAKADVADALAVAKTFFTLSAMAQQAQEISGAHFVTLAPGHKIEDISTAIEKVQTVRDRKQGTVQVKDLASLIACCADQGASGPGYIYADPDARTITAVFNDQRGTSAGWRDHRAVFKAEHTPEFAKWLAQDKKRMAQTDFAEFIEDNLADIAEPAAAVLLEVASTIQATTGINFASAKRLHDGQTQLTYTENIEAKAGASGALQIPREFTLGLRIFKNGDGYKIKARLKYRLQGGGISFWYELDRVERSVEAAFAGYVDVLREKSGYVVLLGRPD
jgi:uncharacterized protein YfdQ (DUF2303 family)